MHCRPDLIVLELDLVVIEQDKLKLSPAHNKNSKGNEVRENLIANLTYKQENFQIRNKVESFQFKEKKKNNDRVSILNTNNNNNNNNDNNNKIKLKHVN